MRSGFVDDAIGFVLGFFFGCCGLALAGLWLRDYLRGAALGIVARMTLGVLYAVIAQPSTGIAHVNLDGSPIGSEFPWELVLAFGIGTACTLGGIAGAIWAFGGGSDDDGDDPPEPPPEQWVRYDRRR